MCEVLKLVTAYYEIKPEDLLETRINGHSTELRQYNDEGHENAQKKGIPKVKKTPKNKKQTHLKKHSGFLLPCHLIRDLFIFKWDKGWTLRLPNQSRAWC